MAKAIKVTCCKAGSSPRKMAASGAKAAGDAVELEYDQDFKNVTVFGADAAGNRAPIDAVATLTPPPTSSDTSVLAVDPPSGPVTFAAHGVKPGPAVVTIVATWNDGSIGPFTIDWPLTVKPGPVSGLVIDPGTPSARP